jgi:hypothetical protein
VVLQHEAGRPRGFCEPRRLQTSSCNQATIDAASGSPRKLVGSGTVAEYTAGKDFVVYSLASLAGLQTSTPCRSPAAHRAALQRPGVESRLLVFPDENRWVLNPKTACSGIAPSSIGSADT